MTCDPFFLQKMNECVICVSWNVIENGELMKYEPPEKYLSTTYLKPKKLLFADYKYAINVCHEKLRNKEWNKKILECIVQLIILERIDKTR